MYEMGASYMAFSVLFLLTSIGLFMGVHKKNHRYTWPWLTVSAFAILYFMIRLIIHGFSQEILSIIEQIFLFFGIILLSFFYVYVYSFKQQIRNLNTQVSITTNQPEIMQPNQYSQIPTIDGRNLHPAYTVYSSNLQPPMNIPTSSNSAPPIQLPPLFYPPPTQPNPIIKPPNPAFYTQPYSEYSPYLSLPFTPAFTTQNPPPANFTTQNPPPANFTSQNNPSASYNFSIPAISSHLPHNPENLPKFLDPSAPATHT